MEPLAEPREDRPVRWYAREAIPLFVLTIFFSALVLAVVSAAVEGDLLKVSSLVVQEGITLILLLVWVTRVSHAEPADLGFRDWTGTNVARGIGVAAIAIVASQAILLVADQIRRALTDGPIEQPQQVQLDQSPELGTAVLMALAVLILAPVAEEAFFRGFIYRGLRRSYGIVPSVLISGVIFGVIHVFAATSASQFTLFLQIVVPPLIVVGCIFALAVERTGSIVPTIVAHFLFNLLGFVQFMRTPEN